MQDGIPLLPPRLFGAGPRRRTEAPIDAVVVAETFEMAAGVCGPWLQAVAIVSNQGPQERTLGRDIPVVADLGDDLGKIADGDLLLVDGDRGVVLVDPDGATLAAYQADREKVRPRKRLFLDFPHQPAATTDGRAIQIVGEANCIEGIDEVVAAGVDAVFLAADSGLLPSDLSDDEQLARLLNLGERLLGKPLLLLGSREHVDMRALLRAAQWIDLTLASPLARAEDAVKLTRHIAEIRDELLEQEVTFGDLRLAAEAPLGSPFDEGLLDQGIARILITDLDRMDRNMAASWDWIESLTLAAGRAVTPVLARTALEDPSLLERLVGLGVSGLGVPAIVLPGLKDRIRGLSYGECRENLLWRNEATS
jgi:phosphotransferase system enzyme I (PtsI)